jgi:gamma-glutamyl-gamma-aminobutyrate hydrolase PuuD
VFPTNPNLRIAVYGSEVRATGKGIGLWAAGYQGALTAAGAAPTFLPAATGAEPWNEVLEGFHGVVVATYTKATPGKMGDVESLCLWCKQHRFPLLAIDQGLLAMNSAFGGLNYQDLPREVPEALQHRCPPESGLRHAINVQPGTMLASLYGEGEIIVNSEHRQAVQRVAGGFQSGGIALDGVIESIESKSETWFALGVQWQPASPTASGLDIQVFRGLVDAAAQGLAKGTFLPPRKLAMAG